jgi:hypothetical protein
VVHVIEDVGSKNEESLDGFALESRAGIVMVLVNPDATLPMEVTLRGLPNNTGAKTFFYDRSPIPLSGAFQTGDDGIARVRLGCHGVMILSFAGH